jgi:hypothetical protein
MIVGDQRKEDQIFTREIRCMVKRVKSSTSDCSKPAWIRVGNLIVIWFDFLPYLTSFKKLLLKFYSSFNYVLCLDPLTFK